MNNKEIIGVFDSGVGGLTVARSIYENIPFSKLIYFGDLAHLPYGDKSESAIQAFSVRIAEFLFNKGCTTIVIACNSASSVASDLLKEYFKNKIKIVNVIDPMVDYIQKRYSGKDVGLIGTKRTIESGVYQEKLHNKDSSINLISLATPLLVPMIEEGFIEERISGEVLNNYLSSENFNSISAMILGCTHYPLIRNQIQNFFGSKVDVIDSTRIIVNSLMSNNEENYYEKGGMAEFYVSDYTKSFERSGKYFFGSEISFIKTNLWP